MAMMFRPSMRSIRGALSVPHGGANIDSVDLTVLLDRVRKGDASARDELIERFYPAVREMVHRELSLDIRRGRPWMAALFSTGDVVHDVFLGVLKNLSRFEGDDERSFEAYLTSTVVHRLIYMIRHHQAGRRDARRRATAGADTLLPADETDSPVQAAAQLESNAVVRSEMVQLAPRDQALLEKRFRQGASYRVIAEELGLPSAEAARKAVRMARARLLVRLRAHGIDEA